MPVNLLALTAETAEIDGHPRCVLLATSAGEVISDFGTRPSTGKSRTGGITGSRCLKFLVEAGQAGSELVTYGVDGFASAVLADMTERDRREMNAKPGEPYFWRDSKIILRPGLSFSIDKPPMKTPTCVLDARALFESELSDALAEWRIAMPRSAPAGADGQKRCRAAVRHCHALAALVGAATRDGWIGADGIAGAVAWRDELRAGVPSPPRRDLLEQLFGEDRPDPSELSFPCLNCGKPVAIRPWLYCGLKCRAVAGAVRYARGALADPDRRTHPDIAWAVGQMYPEAPGYLGSVSADVALAIRYRIGFALGGGYDAAARRLTSNQRAAVFKRDKGRCRVCGQPAEQVDHIDGPIEGDINHPDNLQAICLSCHRAKTEQSFRSPTAAEQKELDAINARIETPEEPDRLCDRYGFDWRWASAERQAMADAVATRDERVIGSVLATDLRLERRWRRMPGVGPKAALMLARLGIANLEELATASPRMLDSQWKRLGLDTPTQRDRKILVELSDRARAAPSGFVGRP